MMQNSSENLLTNICEAVEALCDLDTGSSSVATSVKLVSSSEIVGHRNAPRGELFLAVVTTDEDNRVEVREHVPFTGNTMECLLSLGNKISRELTVAMEEIRTEFEEEFSQETTDVAAILDNTGSDVFSEWESILEDARDRIDAIRTKFERLVEKNEERHQRMSDAFDSLEESLEEFETKSSAEKPEEVVILPTPPIPAPATIPEDWKKVLDSMETDSREYNE